MGHLARVQTLPLPDVATTNALDVALKLQNYYYFIVLLI